MLRLLLILVLLATPLTAQTTEAELQARLVHQPLYLRGQWSDDKLAFDPGGKLLVPSASASFTVSGVDVQAVKLTPSGITLEAQRIGLRFDKDSAERIPLAEGRAFGRRPVKLHLTIQASQGGDYGPALDSIFTARVADFVSTLPDYWQTYGAQRLAPAIITPAGLLQLGPEAPKPPSPRPPSPGFSRIGGSVAAPVALRIPQPKFPREARYTRISGSVLIYLQVDVHGDPANVRILRPIGFGLDEAAVDAVKSYKFKPAEEENKPVPVEMNVEVNFNIY